jgi:hypothetical protein
VLAPGAPATNKQVANAELFVVYSSLSTATGDLGHASYGLVAS